MDEVRVEEAEEEEVESNGEKMNRYLQLYNQSVDSTRPLNEQVYHDFPQSHQAAHSGRDYTT